MSSKPKHSLADTYFEMIENLVRRGLVRQGDIARAPDSTFTIFVRVRGTFTKLLVQTLQEFGWIFDMDHCRIAGTTVHNPQEFYVQLIFKRRGK